MRYLLPTPHQFWSYSSDVVVSSSPLVAVVAVIVLKAPGRPRAGSFEALRGGASHHGAQPPRDTATVGHSHHGAQPPWDMGHSHPGGQRPGWLSATMGHSHHEAQPPWGTDSHRCNPLQERRLRGMSNLHSFTGSCDTPLAVGRALGSMSVPQVPIGALLRLAATRTFVSNIRDYVERASPHQGFTPVCSAGAAGVRWRQTAHAPA